MFWLALLSVVVAIVWTAFVVFRHDVADVAPVFLGDQSLIPIWILTVILLIGAWVFG